MTAQRARRPARLRSGRAATTARATPRAALYVRISDDKEGRELGVQRQEKRGRELADRLGAEIVGVYCDNDISASTRSRKPRPDYNQMIEDAKAGMFEMIIAYTSGRLTRRPLEHEGQIELAQDYGIEFQYVASPSFDLNTAAGRRIARTLAAQDAGEAEDISERALEKKAQARDAGRRHGGNRPFGYERDGVVVRPHEAALIDDAMDLVLAGMSQNYVRRHWDKVSPRCEWKGPWVTKLAQRDPATLSTAEAAILADVREQIAAAPVSARLLDDLGDKRTARWAASYLQKREVPNGQAWNLQAIKIILTNPRNVGLIENSDGELIEAEWPGIVSEEKWRAVCAVISERGKQFQDNDLKWIGRSLYMCGMEGCESDMRNSGTTSSKGKRTGIYRCRAKSHVGIQAAEVDEYVRATAVAILRRDGAGLLAKPVEPIDSSALRIEANVLRARLAEARNSYADLKIDEADWFAVRDRITPKLQKIEFKLARVLTRSALTGIADTPDPGAAFLAASPNQQRAMVREMMTVTILPLQPHRPRGAVDLGRVVIAEKNPSVEVVAA